MYIYLIPEHKALEINPIHYYLLQILSKCLNNTESYLRYYEIFLLQIKNLKLIEFSEKKKFYSQTFFF